MKEKVIMLKKEKQKCQEIKCSNLVNLYFRSRKKRTKWTNIKERVTQHKQKKKKKKKNIRKKGVVTQLIHPFEAERKELKMQRNDLFDSRFTGH